MTPVGPSEPPLPPMFPYTHRQVARLSGISSGYLSQLMSGARCPAPPVRRRLLRVLGLSDFDDLFIMEVDPR